jgi:hypothetical protein
MSATEALPSVCWRRQVPQKHDNTALPGVKSKIHPNCLPALGSSKHLYSRIPLMFLA